MMNNQLIKHNTLAELLRFSVTGGLSSLVHFTVVVLLVEFGQLLPLTANVIAFLTAFSVSYFGHRHFTFARADKSFSTASLPRFFTIATMSFVMNESLFYYLLHGLNMYYPVALIIVLATVSAFTFTLSKFWAFR